MRDIGFAVQPKTYLTARNGSVFKKITAPIRGIGEIAWRGASSWLGGSNQGFIGSMSAAFAGHTLLHSNDGFGGRISTGFSPDGLINSIRIGMGRRNVPGRFHDETGIQHDPMSIAQTRPVGAGVYARFQQLQMGAMENGAGTYSFRPDSRRTQNCATSAIREMEGFVSSSKAHVGLMGELQSVQRRLVKGENIRQAVANNNGSRIYSANQQMEKRSLGYLEKRTISLKKTVERAASRGVGNQGYVTRNFVNTGATHNRV